MAAGLLENQTDIAGIATISAGKFRRYHTQSWFRHLLDVETNLLNIRDVFRTLVGVVEAWMLLRRERPDAIFIKGGFVAVPIGFVASRLKVPFMTHDSDSVPGLANRLIARWAAYHATGMPEEFYSYPKAKTKFVGVPLAPQYQLVSEVNQADFRQEMGINRSGHVLLVAGGSSGAQRVNQAFAPVADQLLAKYGDLTIVHQVGRGQLGTYSTEHDRRLIVAEFFGPEDMYRYSGAADLIITRGGATNIAEFAAQAKACVVIPNPLLTGGHQLKNAQHLADQGAIEVVTEAKMQSEKFFDTICSLLDDPAGRQQLAYKLGGLARPKAAQDTALLLLELINKH